MAESEYVAGLELGQGVNVEQWTLHGKAITGDEAPAIDHAQGLQVSFDLRVLRSHEEVTSTFALSAEVSYGGLFSASISASFLNSSKVSRYRTYVLAKCVVRLPETIIRNVRLTDEAAALAPTIDRDAFIKVYGTSFLAGVKRGGYYFGLIEIESTSAEEQRAIAVAVSGSGWGVSADLSVSQRIERVSSGMSKRVFALWQGGSEALKPPTTPEDVIANAVHFPAEMRANPVVVAGIYAKYDDVLLVPYRAGLGQFAWDQRQRDIRTLGQRYLRLNQLRSDFEFVLDHYNDFQRGTGVVFSVAGRPLKNVSLASVGADQLTALSVEGEDRQGQGSAPIAASAIAAEVRSISERLEEVVVNADLCRAGEPYALPAPYAATVALPEIVGKNMELELIKRALVPSGTIVMWSGPATAVPEGWQLCDGTAGTPDLQARFVVGASKVGAPQSHQYGEADQHTHPVDPPAATFTTDRGGTHSHLFPGQWYARKFDDGDWTGIDTGGDYGNSGVQANGDHDHGVRIDLGEFRTGESSGENRPRWYALCFIVKK